MKSTIEKFKKFIRFIVTIFASREFGFIYCLSGTVAQIAHTYYLTEQISALNGNWKIFQAIMLSFFISSSLLYFVVIADNGESKESKRIRLSVNLFMIIEILINFYYYARHLIIDSEKVQIFDFIFATLVSCLIPVTIKLYASLIRAKEWIEEINGTLLLEKNEIKLDNSLIQSQIEIAIEKFKKEFNDTPENLTELIQEQIENLKKSILSDMDSEISEAFQKNQNLFLVQFENRCKMIGKNQLESIKIE